MRGIGIVAALVLFPFAAGAADATHTGFNLGLDAGVHNVRGNFFQNDVKPGSAVKLQLGWRITPQVSVETGFTTATGKSEDLDATVNFVHILNVDARFFPLGAGRLEPNLLAGYTLVSGASVEIGDITVSYTGSSPTLGAGARFHVTDLLYVQGDIRYLYTRYTRGSIEGPGIDETGNLSRQGHGDAIMFLVGGGLQF